VIERIRANADVDEPVNASFGVAVYGEQGSADDLFGRADAAMYSAKRSGGCVAVAA
jgi:GGDEF domain-containing protein